MVRVTEVLSVVNRFAGVDPRVLEAAAQLGTLCHAHCLGYLRGYCMPVPAEIRPYFDAFREWADVMVEEVIGVEEEVVLESLQLVGHLDLAARLKGYGPSIVDLKRVAHVERPIVAMQLAAYRSLAAVKWPDIEFHHVFALQARADYRMHLIPLDDPQAWNAFLCAFSLRNFLGRK